jgi:hypothetical protein
MGEDGEWVWGEGGEVVGREDGVVSSEVDGLDADGEREGGREWRRGRGAMDWMVGLWETAATGLAV